MRIEKPSRRHIYPRQIRNSISQEFSRLP